MTPRIGSLCSGYGGLDMAVTAVLGGEVAWHAQYDPDDAAQSAARILAHHWPRVPNHGDITRIDWSRVEPVDILTAGFPCQDISQAGKRAGIEGAKSGIWTHVADAISHLRPRLVFLENVAAITVRGLDRVAGDLAALGFDAEWTCLRASDVGAPHRRERWFCLAWPADTVREGLPGRGVPGAAPERHHAAEDADGATCGEWRIAAPGQAPGGWAWADACGRSGAPAADADRAGARPERDRDPLRSETDDEHDGLDVAGCVLDWGAYGPAIARWDHVIGWPAPAPTEPGRTGPRLSPHFVEWLMGVPAGHVTGVPGLSRTAQLRALGNGVVPLQAETALWMLLPAVPVDPWRATEPGPAGSVQPSLFEAVA